MKKIIIAAAVVMFIVVMSTMALTAAHRAIEESNRTIERIDRKIKLYAD